MMKKSLVRGLSLLAVLFVIHGCSKKDVTSVKTSTASTAAVTPEDYFKAVFFLDGPLAQNLGDYSKLSPGNILADANKLAGLRTIEEKTVAYISSVNKNFFTDFKANVTSGNYSTVENAIKGSSTLFADALTHVTDLKQASLNSPNPADPAMVEASRQFSPIGNLPISASIDKLRSIITPSVQAGALSSLTTAPSATVSFYQYTVVFLYVGGFIAFALAVVVPASIEAKELHGIATLNNSNSYLHQDYISTVTSNFVNAEQK